ncbi:hypothetical protein [Nesterenkonia sp. CF4.4]
MKAAEMKQTADSLAAVLEEIQDGDLAATKSGRAFLKGAETALRSAAEDK